MFHALHPYVYKEAHAQATIIQFSNIQWCMVIHHSQMETNEAGICIVNMLIVSMMDNQ